MNITLRVLDSGIGITKGDYNIIEFIDDSFLLDRTDRMIVGGKPSIHVVEFFIWGLLGKLRIFYA